MPETHHGHLVLVGSLSRFISIAVIFKKANWRRKGFVTTDNPRLWFIIKEESPWQGLERNGHITSTFESRGK